MFDVFYIGNKPNLFVHEREIKSITDAQQLSRTRYCWVINYLCDYTHFDFLWEPVPWESEFIHVWPSEIDGYAAVQLVPRDVVNPQYHYHADTVKSLSRPENYRTIIPCDFNYSWLPSPFDPPYVYVFGNQHWPPEIMPTVEYHVPGATERKFVHDVRATLAESKKNWEIPVDLVDDEFDYSWLPDPGDPRYIYQFGTQHQRTGGPRYVVPGATEVKYVDQITIKVSDTTPIYGINHMDGNDMPECVKVTRYVDNYLDTLTRIANNIPHEHEFVWIVSSVCDYTNFDFTWHPEQWQATMLHVFASDGEKFGDTFYMHVPTFKERIKKCELLDWYALNFVQGVSVPRHKLPVIIHDDDVHVNKVKTTQWNGPLAIFTTDNNIDDLPCVPLWREKTKTIVPLSAGASSVVVPKSAVSYIKNQLYDYPYIDKTHATGVDSPLDIVFISNGEKCAEHNLWVLKSSLGDKPKNKLHIVENVNGRAAAYHAAAHASTTPWFFAVFAKLEVDWYFPWEWQPDRMQEPKHYIFHAHNEVNRLEYGHQAMIAYNKKLVLNNPGVGLDFTLDSAHEVVPILSGIARYCATPWLAWRTAFREVLKLRASLPDVESEYRIKQWLTPRDPNHHVIVNQEWSHIGAEDALEYYDEVNGDFDELKKSYEWEWLTTYAMIKRNLLPF